MQGGAPIRQLVWVSGQSGSGKTTLGQAFHRLGWGVHFDGDVFGHGGDAVTESGIATEAMLEKRSPRMKDAWTRMEKEGFGRLFKGEEAPLEYWQPFHSMLCEGVAKAWEQCAPSNMVVTFSVYSRLVRDYIRSQLPQVMEIPRAPPLTHSLSLKVQFIVLNDVLGAATERKVQQVVDSAKAEGKGLSEFLSKFGADWAARSDEESLAHLREYCGSVQRGLAPYDASCGEFGIDITSGMTCDDVFTRARSLLLRPVGTTPRLCIRELDEQLDASFVQRLITSSEWTRWIGDRGQDGALYIRTNASHPSRMYLMALRWTGEPVGLCGLLQRAHLPHRDVGYALDQPYVGHGYASEAVQFLLQKEGSRPVLGIVLKENIRSISVLLRNGFKHVEFNENTGTEMYRFDGD